MTEGKSSILPMTNVLVHVWEQCHSYTEVIKGRCLKVNFYLFILFLFLLFGVDLTFILKPIWHGADLTFILKPIWHGADLTWDRFDLGTIWLGPIWLGPIWLGADLTGNPTNHHSTKIATNRSQVKSAPCQIGFKMKVKSAPCQIGFKMKVKSAPNNKNKKRINK
jgi:hypothetical protein